MKGETDLLLLYSKDKVIFKQKISNPEMWDIALARRNQLLKIHL